MDLCKKRLDSLQEDTPMTEELIQIIAPDCCEAMRKSLFSLDNPWQSLHKMHALIGSISSQLADRCLIIVSTPTKKNLVSSTKLQLSLEVPSLHLDDCSKNKTSSDDIIIIDHSEVIVDSVATITTVDNNGDGTNNNKSSLHINDDDDVVVVVDDDTAEKAVEISNNRLYLDETIELMFDRWDQINKSFFEKKNKKFDLTKVPDVSDMVSYTVSYRIISFFSYHQF